MPRINAPTVDEHRRRTVEAILGAAEDLLVENENPLTLGAVGERVGLKRSSLYRYFTNLDELVEAVAVRDFPTWTAAVQRAVESAESPHEAVAAYVRANLLEAVDDRHNWVAGLSRLHLGDAARRRIGALHAGLTEILAEVVREIPGVRHDLCVVAVQALTDAGVKRVGGLAPRERAAHVEWYADAARRIVAG